MPSRYPQLPTLLAVAILICVAWPFSARVEAKEKKGKSASRSKSSKRFSSKRGKHHSNKYAEDNAPIPTNYPIAPDHIEVIESGTASSPDLSHHLNPPLPRATTPQDSSEPDLSAPKQRKNVKIDEGRALQIQKALKQRGFYDGELTGIYDKETIEAMRRFQINQDIPATGYPTAHALKRLGLGNW